MLDASLLSLASILFLVVDPIGCIPTISALIKDFDFRRQRQILFRETGIALIIALFFQYLGEAFLGLMGIADFALQITGGILLLIVAFQMIFAIGLPMAKEENQPPKREPFIFPIATPLLSGPGLLAIIMLQSRIQTSWKLTLALLIAWIGVFAVLAIAPFLQKLLKKSGLIALEQVMGMTLAMLSVEMLVKGTSNFIKTL